MNRPTNIRWFCYYKNDECGAGVRTNLPLPGWEFPKERESFIEFVEFCGAKLPPKSDESCTLNRNRSAPLPRCVPISFRE